MAGCNCGGGLEFEGLSAAYKRILWIVISINGTMFLIEIGGGLLSSSQALLADALDFLGDTLTYSITLLVIGMPLKWRAKAALFKGLSLGLMGIWVFCSTAYHVFVVGIPQAYVMGAIAFMALVANFSSLVLLVKYRNGDSNVRSVWLCSRNDAIGNIAVLLAAAGIWATESAWPDLAVAGVMAALFLWSSVQIVRQAMAEIHGLQPTIDFAECSAVETRQDFPGYG
ncbi:MAG: cation transporter [Gammaproteobacteria bacterium]|nr:cation transporter [Gammaproteobacteria bacterium]